MTAHAAHERAPRTAMDYATMDYQQGYAEGRSPLLHDKDPRLPTGDDPGPRADPDDLDESLCRLPLADGACGGVRTELLRLPVHHDHHHDHHQQQQQHRQHPDDPDGRGDPTVPSSSSSSSSSVAAEDMKDPLLSAAAEPGELEMGAAVEGCSRLFDATRIWRLSLYPADGAAASAAFYTGSPHADSVDSASSPAPRTEESVSPSPHGGARDGSGDEHTDPGGAGGAAPQDKNRRGRTPRDSPGQQAQHTQACSQCGKAFRSGSALNKHYLSHSQERKHVCEVCHKAFKRQDHLASHMVTHQKSKPFSCCAQGCLKSYCDLRSLKRHYESHHKLPYPPEGGQPFPATSPAVARSEAHQPPPDGCPTDAKAPLNGLDPPSHCPDDDPTTRLSPPPPPQQQQHRPTGDAAQTLDSAGLPDDPGAFQLRVVSVTVSAEYTEGVAAAQPDASFLPLPVGGHGLHLAPAMPPVQPAPHDSQNHAPPMPRQQQQQQRQPDGVGSARTPELLSVPKLPEPARPASWPHPAASQLLLAPPGEPPPPPPPPLPPPAQHGPWAAASLTQGAGDRLLPSLPAGADGAAASRSGQKLDSFVQAFAKRKPAVPGAVPSGAPGPPLLLSVFGESDLGDLGDLGGGGAVARRAAAMEQLSPVGAQQFTLPSTHGCHQAQQQQQPPPPPYALQVQGSLPAPFHNQQQQQQQQPHDAYRTHEFQQIQQQLLHQHHHHPHHHHSHHQLQQQQQQQQQTMQTLEQSWQQQQQQVQQVQPVMAQHKIEAIQQQQQQHFPAMSLHQQPQHGYLRLAPQTTQAFAPAPAERPPASECGEPPRLGKPGEARRTYGAHFLQPPVLGQQALRPPHGGAKLAQQHAANTQFQPVAGTAGPGPISVRHLLSSRLLALSAHRPSAPPDGSAHGHTWAQGLQNSVPPLPPHHKPTSPDSVWVAGDGMERAALACALCGRAFRSLPALNGHMRLHSARPPAHAARDTDGTRALAVADAQPRGLEPALPASLPVLAAPLPLSLHALHTGGEGDGNGVVAVKAEPETPPVSPPAEKVAAPPNGDPCAETLGLKSHPGTIPGLAIGNGGGAPGSTVTPTARTTDTQQQQQRKQRPRPQPLILPPAAAAACGAPPPGLGGLPPQQQPPPSGGLPQPPVLYQSQLRSPRLADLMERSPLEPPPYTPPPMLSPVRQGSGLYFSTLLSACAGGGGGPGPPPSLLLTPKAPATPRILLSRSSSLESSGPFSCYGDDSSISIEPRINIGTRFQAEVPGLCERGGPGGTHGADLLWQPWPLLEDDAATQRQVEQLLALASSSAVPGGGTNRELALHVLHQARGDVLAALKTLLSGEVTPWQGPHLHGYHYAGSDSWSKQEKKQFVRAMMAHDKDFLLVQKVVKTKTMAQCVEYYYSWKKLLRLDRKHSARHNEGGHQGNALQPVLGGGGGGGGAASEGASEEAMSRSGEERPQNEADALGGIPGGAPPVPAARHAAVTRLAPSFPCDVVGCRASFASKQALNGHARVHLGLVQPPPRAMARPRGRPLGSGAAKIGAVTAAAGSGGGVGGSGSSGSRGGSPTASSTHSGDAELLAVFPCRECGKVFYKVKSRNAHMKSHRQQEKPDKQSQQKQHEQQEMQQKQQLQLQQQQQQLQHQFLEQMLDGSNHTPRPPSLLCPAAPDLFLPSM
ncbi:zinc finger protein 541-like [Lethenteron reissneri]|uniref:zinc finger protein 541-like n=1 Tax=Lethenteron reissneri TaxID=7753 RepID=UPI002AB6B7AA|nr:zinc finger protein 541-like [Lethenteron reissneri]